MGFWTLYMGFVGAGAGAAPLVAGRVVAGELRVTNAVAGQFASYSVKGEIR